MAYFLIPEVILKNLIDGIVTFVGQDIDNNSGNPQESVTYKSLNGIKMGKFDFYEQAVNVFSREANHPRKIETRMFFDSSRAHLPTVHLNLPSDNQTEGGIGIDAGYVQPEFDDTAGTYREIFTRAFESQYNFMITSDNTLEVVLIYNVLKGMLISFMETLEFEGIRNPRISGQDLNVMSEIIPENVFMRSIAIDFMFEYSAPKLEEKAILDAINFNQTTLGD